MVAEGAKFDQDPPPAPQGDAPPERQSPTIGRIVHYVPNVGETFSGEERPAIIVRVGPAPDTCSLLVFLDGANDPAFRSAPDNSNTLWVTFALYDPKKGPRSWHWHGE